MQAFKFKKQSCVTALLLMMSVGAMAQAATLSVSYGGSSGLTTINAAIKLLQSNQSLHPATINVSGACHENILIQNMDGLTLNAVNGASITDASNGTREVIDVANSHGFTLQGFTITSVCPSGCTSPDAISCYNGADCLLIQNTISGASGGAGVGVYALSKVRIIGGTLQNNGNGLFLTDSGEMLALGVNIRSNDQGVVVVRGASVLIRADNLTPSVIANNGARGIDATESTVIVAGPSNIMDNGAEGVHLDLSSKLVLATFYGPVSITGNVGSGVSLGDLSVARFQGTSHVIGNGQPDVVCNSATSVTRNAKTNIGAGTTNCTN
jgi:copper-binding protein NosD